jgi:hypothetical protein
MNVNIPFRRKRGESVRDLKTAGLPGCLRNAEMLGCLRDA